MSEDLKCARCMAPVSTVSDACVAFVVRASSLRNEADTIQEAITATQEVCLCRTCAPVVMDRYEAAIGSLFTEDGALPEEEATPDV